MYPQPAMHCRGINRASGFTLIEVMVTIVVLAIGLLGLAALHITSMGFNLSANMRSQASNLAYDMADRIRANRTTAVNDDAYTIDDDFVGAVNCNEPPDPDDAPTVAEVDLWEWSCAIRQMLVNGRATIVRTNNTQIAISIEWDNPREEDPEIFSLVTRL